jgi:hypothetical protein
MAKVTRQGWGAEGTNALDPNYFDDQEAKAELRRQKKSLGTAPRNPAAAGEEARKPAAGSLPNDGTLSSKDRTGVALPVDGWQWSG